MRSTRQVSCRTSSQTKSAQRCPHSHHRMTKILHAFPAFTPSTSCTCTQLQLADTALFLLYVDIPSQPPRSTLTSHFSSESTSSATPHSRPIVIELPSSVSRKPKTSSTYTPIPPLSARGDISGYVLHLVSPSPPAAPRVVEEAWVGGTGRQ